MAKKINNNGTNGNSPLAPKTAEGGTWVVLTNNLRGIYFGELREEPDSNGTVTLYNMRHCFKFNVHPDAKGTWGLALRGPQADSQVGPTLPWLRIRNVANYAPLTEEALANWLAAKWE